MTNPATTVEHVAWLRFRSRGDNHNLKWLEVCNSDDERAFKVYRQSDIDVLIAERDQAVKERDAALAEVERLREAVLEKGYSRSEISRMLVCLYCGASQDDLSRALLMDFPHKTDCIVRRLENERGGE